MTQEELAALWMKIYRDECSKMIAQGFDYDEATALAGKAAYKQCDKLSRALKDK